MPPYQVGVRAKPLVPHVHDSNNPLATPTPALGNVFEVAKEIEIAVGDLGRLQLYSLARHS